MSIPKLELASIHNSYVIIAVIFEIRDDRVKDILIIKIGALGDLSFALPAAKALKESLQCHVTWVVGKSCQAFLAGHPHIDRLVIVDDKKLYSKNLLVRAGELAKLYFNLRQRYDSVLIMHRDPIYYQAFRALSRDTVLQMVREKKENAPHQIYTAPLSTHESVAIKNFTTAVVRHYAPQISSITWEWDYSHIHPAGINLPEHYAVLHLGGGSNTKTEFRLKCWPHWNEFIFKLLDQTNLNLVFVGAPSEESEYLKIQEKIQQRFPEKIKRCLNLIGKTNLPGLVDVIRRCDFFVGVDSGPLHIADSMDKKAIGLFGPTSAISWGLLSKNSKTLNHVVPCSPCYQDDGVFPECHFQHQCMKLLDSERVLDVVKSFI